MKNNYKNTKKFEITLGSRYVLTLLFFIVFVLSSTSVFSQTNATNIDSGVTFQWSDTQSVPGDPATLQSITVNSTPYSLFRIPTGYTMTQLGPPTGDPTVAHNNNNIRLNGGFTETTSSSATWNASALAAFQDRNLNHYFEANGNGKNICNNYTQETTTTAQRQTLSYSPGVVVDSNSLIAVTERNANNCFHIEVFGTPAGGGATISLGETFVNNNSTQWGYGGTGTSSSFGTTGAVTPPPTPQTATSSDYWLSDRVIDNYGTIGIALFNLDDIAPVGSIITALQLTAATVDHGDGKVFMMTVADSDDDGFLDINDLDDDNDGILDIEESNGNEPDGDEDGDGIPNWNDTTDNGTGDGSITSYVDSNGDGIPDVYDNDSDGIPNHLDTDSDNDGCPDAIEGAGNFTNDDLTSSNNLADEDEGSVDTDGVPTNTGSPQATTSAVTTSDVISSINLAPDPTVVCAGSNITLTTTPSGIRVTDFGSTGSTADDTTIAIPSGDYIYSWYLGATKLTDTAPYSGTSTSELTITSATLALNTNVYRVEVTTVNNSCSEEEDVTLTVINEADLSLTKGSENASGTTITTANVNELVYYRVTLANDGPCDATGVTVQDRLPTGVSYIQASSTITEGTFTVDGSNVGTWDLSGLTIASGTTKEIVIAVNVGAGCSDITNFVQVMSSDQTDPDSTPANNN